MNTAIFGLGNTLLDLFVTLALISLVAIWGALIVFTFNDARKRLSDPFLITCATAGSFFPFVGTLVYTILRPQELLDDVQERDWDLKATQATLRQQRATSCRKCGYPAEPEFLKCPSCRSRLREPCPSCSRPVGVEWKLCPYCEKTLIEPSRKSSRRGEGAESSGRGSRAKAARSRAETSTEPKKRSTASADSGSRSRKPSGQGAATRTRKTSGSDAEPPTAENPSAPKSGARSASRRSADKPINSPESGEGN